MSHHHIQSQQPQTLSTNNNNHNHSKQQFEQLTIHISRPIGSLSSCQLIYFQWSLFMALVILFFSVVEQSWSNLRIVVYSVLFMLLQTLRQTSRQLQTMDPLQLSPYRQLIKHLTLLIQANLTYLLFRILLHHHTIYSFLLFLHYSVVGVISFQRSKKNYDITLGLQTNTQLLYKMLTPLILFFLSIVVTQNNITQLSIVQLLLLTVTLFLALQIKLLLSNQECIMFGWQRHQGKPHLVFGKYLAMKKIMFAVCAIVALQNMLFIIPSIGQSANSTLFLSLLLGGYVMWLDYASRKGKTHLFEK